MQRWFSPALVLYSEDPRRTAAFYKAIGLSFEKGRHGSGPPRFAAELDDFTLEIYPQPKRRRRRGAGSSRLILHVADPERIMAELASLGASAGRHKEGACGLSVLVRDPDGREVLLVRPE